MGDETSSLVPLASGLTRDAVSYRGRFIAASLHSLNISDIFGKVNLSYIGLKLFRRCCMSIRLNSGGRSGHKTPLPFDIEIEIRAEIAAHRYEWATTWTCGQNNRMTYVYTVITRLSPQRRSTTILGRNSWHRCCDWSLAPRTESVFRSSHGRQENAGRPAHMVEWEKERRIGW